MGDAFHCSLFATCFDDRQDNKSGSNASGPISSQTAEVSVSSPQMHALASSTASPSALVRHCPTVNPRPAAALPVLGSAARGKFGHLSRAFSFGRQKQNATGKSVGSSGGDTKSKQREIVSLAECGNNPVSC